MGCPKTPGHWNSSSFWAAASLSKLAILTEFCYCNTPTWALPLFELPGGAPSTSGCSGRGSHGARVPPHTRDPDRGSTPKNSKGQRGANSRQLTTSQPVPRHSPRLLDRLLPQRQCLTTREWLLDVCCTHQSSLDTGPPGNGDTDLSLGNTTLQEKDRGEVAYDLL